MSDIDSIENIGNETNSPEKAKADAHRADYSQHGFTEVYLPAFVTTVLFPICSLTDGIQLTEPAAGEGPLE